MKRTLIVWCTMSVAAAAAHGQGTFQNLDFEDARIIFEATGFVGDVATTNALPGWSAFAGASQLSIVQFGVLGGFFPVHLYARTNGGSISGDFTLLLSWLGSSPDGSISQTGVIPADTQSLLFKSGTPPLVSVNGENLLVAALTTSPDYIVYGTDISRFAGQTASLVFAAEFNTVAWIDDIQFSPEPIPEPSVFALLLLGSGVLLCRRRGFR